MEDATTNKETARLPRVLLLGRPNVGKSTLFNRVADKRVAITDPIPHTTRDLLAEVVTYKGVSFELLDAAGFLDRPDDTLQEAIQRGLGSALNDADLLVFMLDAEEGLTAVDREITGLLRREGKEYVVCANKVHGPADEPAVAEFYELGLEGEILPISAKGGYNVKKLLALIVERLSEIETAGAGARPALKIAVAGRPNVGKSTLINKILGTERVVVDDRPGTTRDAVDITFDYGSERYMLVDTAGIRRKSRKKDALEEYSLNKALAAVKRADVAVIVLDALEGPTQQDARIAGYAHNRGVGAIVFLNKIDLLEGTEHTVESVIEDTRIEMKYLSYAPVLPASALRDADLMWLLSAAAEIGANRRRRIPTAELNEYLRGELETYRFTRKGREVKLFYATQTDVAPPTFTLFINLKTEPHFSYKRFIENRLRDGYDFTGTPIRLEFRPKEKRRG
ncbi:MAG: ribosome biogenesis GTPase Der [Candidatus Coatesbacteria bacterium]|nr:MAG: ribosome biogenesis GTPase Der [Candidatus Coatesbacteria bacterium]